MRAVFQALWNLQLLRAVFCDILFNITFSANLLLVKLIVVSEMVHYSRDRRCLYIFLNRNESERKMKK